MGDGSRVPLPQTRLAIHECVKRIPHTRVEILEGKNWGEGAGACALGRINGGENKRRRNVFEGNGEIERWDLIFVMNWYILYMKLMKRKISIFKKVFRNNTGKRNLQINFCDCIRPSLVAWLIWYRILHIRAWKYLEFRWTLQKLCNNAHQIQTDYYRWILQKLMEFKKVFLNSTGKRNFAIFF